MGLLLCAFYDCFFTFSTTPPSISYSPPSPIPSYYSSTHLLCCFCFPLFIGFWLSFCIETVLNSDFERGFPWVCLGFIWFRGGLNDEVFAFWSCCGRDLVGGEVVFWDLNFGFGVHSCGRRNPFFRLSCRTFHSNSPSSFFGHAPALSLLSCSPIGRYRSSPIFNI